MTDPRRAEEKRIRAQNQTQSQKKENGSVHLHQLAEDVEATSASHQCGGKSEGSCVAQTETHMSAK